MIHCNTGGGGGAISSHKQPHPLLISHPETHTSSSAVAMFHPHRAHFIPPPQPGAISSPTERISSHRVSHPIRACHHIRVYHPIEATKHVIPPGHSHPHRAHLIPSGISSHRASHPIRVNHPTPGYQAMSYHRGHFSSPPDISLPLVCVSHRRDIFFAEKVILSKKAHNNSFHIYISLSLF